MANDLPTQIATLMALLQKGGQQGMQTGSQPLQNPQVQALAQSPAMANTGGLPPPTQQNNLIQSLQGLNPTPASMPSLMTLGLNAPLPLPNADPQGQQANSPVDPFAAALGQ